MTTNTRDTIPMGVLAPKSAAPVKPPPSRNSLELMLKQGPDMVAMVLQLIETFSLPYRIEVSDGKFPVDGVEPTIPAGYGILRDTLSRGELFLNQFITVDEESVQMKRDAAKMALSEHEVLIIGDTGTGKEIIARAMIGKREGRVMAINCSALPDQLIESELFGHKRGSFTGAEGDKTGLMKAADDGVMFLDEIGDLPLSVQAKLLRALQEKKIRKVGALSDESINCKFVCATHKNLDEMVNKGEFRKDLYARISTLELRIKPLSERRCDIEPIILSLPKGKEFFDKFKVQLLDGMLQLPYNVRSLQQLVTRYNVLGRVTI